MPNYEKSKDIFIQRKVSDGSFEEYPLVVKPNSVIITNENNDLMLMDTSSFIAGTGSITLSISSSFSTTSSYSYNTPSSKTASYVRGVNVDGIVSYSSQSISSSFASSSISSSYSLSSLSSSFSPINPTYSASVSNIINTKQPTLTNQLYVITSSLALSASYYPTQIIQTTVASASWVSSSVKIINSDTASVANSILFNNLKTTDTPTFASINAGASVTATTFIGNLNGNVVGNLTGNSTGSIFGSASYAKSSNSASYATNAGNAISAQDSSTAEKAALADTASYILPINISNNYSSSVSTQIGLKQNILTNSLYVLTASLALTASYASNSGGTSLGTGSTYPITSSWAVNSLSASYVSFSQSYQANTVSSSWASSFISSSYISASSIDGQLFNSQLPLIINATHASTSTTSINSMFSDTASYALNADTATISVSASYAPGNPSISASYALNSDTASYANGYVLKSLAIAYAVAL